MFSRRRRKLRFLFGLADVLLLLAAFEAAYRTRVDLPFEHLFYLLTSTKALLLGFIVPLWLLIAQWFGIYDRLETARPFTIVADSFRQSFAGGVAVVLYQYLLRLDLSRGFMVLFACYAWLFIALFRVVAMRVSVALRASLAQPLHLMVVGTGERARRLGETIEHSASFGARLVGFLSENPNAEPGTLRLASEHRIHPLSRLPDLLRTRVIDEILFAVDSEKLAGTRGRLPVVRRGRRAHARRRGLLPARQQHGLSRAARSGAAADLLGRAARRDPPDAEARHRRCRGRRRRSSCCSPVMLARRAAGPAHLAGPGDFQPDSMRAERTALRALQVPLDVPGRRAAESRRRAPQSDKTTAFKMPDDPRLTPIGRGSAQVLHRRVAAVWNVLRGDMSLVGPRPAIPEEVEQYQAVAAAAPAHAARADLPVGARRAAITLDFETWMKLDMQYIDNWSLALDWKILLRTDAAGAHRERGD